MKKFLSIAALLLAFAAIANAQGKLGFSVEAGLNLSKFTGDTDDLVEEGSCDMKSGLNIGVMVDVPFTDAIYLKSGLNPNLSLEINPSRFLMTAIRNHLK